MRHLLFILTTELLVREWGVGCGSRDEATVGHNCDDDDREVMSIPTTISWESSFLLLSRHYHTHSSESSSAADVAIIRNMTTSI